MLTDEQKWWQPDCLECCQFYLAVFGHSKVRKRMINQTSKGAVLIVSWRRIRMWWRKIFLVLWSQNPSVLCWTVFWLFFNPKQVLLTIFGHSKVRKGGINDTSKDTFVIVFLRRIKMWWRTLFTILWSQNPSTLCWT